MSPKVAEQLSTAINRHYCKWLNACRYKSALIGMGSYAEDLLHDALLFFIQKPEDYIESVLSDQSSGYNHLYRLILSIIYQKTIDRARSRRSLFNIDNQYKETSLSGDNQIIWDNLSEDDYAKFREVSCNIRNDDFITPLPNGMYVRLTKGWVSGWVHSYSVEKRRYTYWLYSAFVGSRGKGEKPHKLKTSSSRHKAYMALMDYNRRFCE